MKPDPTGAHRDYIDEMIDQMEYQRHQFGECDGAKGGCFYCQDDECEKKGGIKI